MEILFDSRQLIFAFSANKPHLPVSLPSLLLFNNVDAWYRFSPKRKHRHRGNPLFCEYIFIYKTNTYTTYSTNITSTFTLTLNLLLTLLILIKIYTCTSYNIYLTVFLKRFPQSHDSCKLVIYFLGKKNPGGGGWVGIFNGRTLGLLELTQPEMLSFFYYLFSSTPPPPYPKPFPPYPIGVKFCPGYTRLNFSSRGISEVPLINKLSVTAA